MIEEVIKWSGLSGSERTTLLQRPAVAADDSIRETAQTIVRDVQDRGNTALLDYAKKFDSAALDSVRVDEEEFLWAETQLTQDSLTAIDVAIDNVRRFHKAQVPADIDLETMAGVRCQRISQPLDAVGLYVPAGTAPLPSAAIMLAVPAAIAGCPIRVMCTPPRPDGNADPAVLIAARKAGIKDVFKVGGAQAVAAMAYGTETVPKCVKIFGPGNAWVTAAKSLVAADADGAAIDLPAGPSEVLVIADDTAKPQFVAADLLSQAEHGIDSQVLLVTDSETLALQVRSAIEEQLSGLTRRDTASESLKYSRIIVVDTIQDAVALSNAYAPEHLIVQTRAPRDLLETLRNAGSIFLGPWTPESIGDYCSGTNHVLPTYGYARNYSGLGLEQFMRQTSIQELTRKGLENLGPTAIELAELEGLGAHALAVQVRLESSS